MLFRGIITLSIINFVVFDKKSLSSFGFATSGDRLFLLSLNLCVLVKLMELIATIWLAKDKILLKLLEKYDIIYYINSQYKFM